MLQGASLCFWVYFKEQECADLTLAVSSLLPDLGDWYKGRV